MSFSWIHVSSLSTVPRLIGGRWCIDKKYTSEVSSVVLIGANIHKWCVPAMRISWPGGTIWEQKWGKVENPSRTRRWDIGSSWIVSAVVCTFSAQSWNQLSIEFKFEFILFNSFLDRFWQRWNEGWDAPKTRTGWIFQIWMFSSFLFQFFYWSWF